MNQKKCKKMCCVVDYHNTYQTGHRLFSFPNRVHEKELKLKWIYAIKRIKYVNIYIFLNIFKY